MTSLLAAAERCWAKGKYRIRSEPVRWWLSDHDWTAIRAAVDAATHHRIEVIPRRLFDIPISIERSNQPSRLVLEDGTALPLYDPEQASK